MSLAKNILSGILILGIFSLHPSLNKGENPLTYLHYFVYGNSFSLSYNNALDKNSIVVKWICENSNVNCQELIIYKNGKKINNVPFEEGNQKLVVYYNNKIVGNLNQNKLNKTQAHQYYIKLEAKSNMLTLNAAVIGPASSKISHSFSIAELILAQN